MTLHEQIIEKSMKGLNTTQASSFQAGDNPKSKIQN
jgi:hypothetical protein